MIWWRMKDSFFNWWFEKMMLIDILRKWCESRETTPLWSISALCSSKKSDFTKNVTVERLASMIRVTKDSSVKNPLRYTAKERRWKSTPLPWARQILLLKKTSTTLRCKSGFGAPMRQWCWRRWQAERQKEKKCSRKKMFWKRNRKTKEKWKI